MIQESTLSMQLKDVEDKLLSNGWEKSELRLAVPEYRFYNKRALGFQLLKDDVFLHVLISSDGIDAVMHKKPSEKDVWTRVGVIPIHLIQNVAEEIFRDNAALTLDTLREQYESLKYFNKDTLEIIDKQVLIDSFENTELRIALINEMLFVNRLSTISRNIAWIAANKHRPFQAKLFKEKITNPASEKDEYGNIKGFGMKMNHRVWDLYEAFHNEIFEITTEEENDDTED